MSKYTETIKQEELNRYAAKTSVREIAESLSISRNTIYKWIKEQGNTSHKPIKSNLRKLENKIKCLEGIIEILQSVDFKANFPLDEKLSALEQLYGKYSIHILCDALRVPRESFYTKQTR